MVVTLDEDTVTHEAEAARARVAARAGVPLA
jgi:hypothetical protein